MTTHIVSDRFTAAEALGFVNYIASSSSLDDLEATIRPCAMDLKKFRDLSPYWKLLPRQFVSQWQHYRQPPATLFTRLLRRLCHYERCWKVIHTVRRCLRM